MTQQITIVGAGMAGLLAANMLHRHKPVVIEQQAALPNNHSAVLRFGSDKVADVLGVPFKRVQMIKSALPHSNPVADSLLYAAKCGGIARSDRSITTDVVKGDRWIAPPDLIERMAKGVDVRFGSALQLNAEFNHLISTMPMPALMKLLEYPEQPEFSYVEGANLRFKAWRVDAYVSLYVPNPAYMFNRISVTGDEVIAEYAFPSVHDKDHFAARMFDNKSIQKEEAHSVSQLLGILACDYDTVTVTNQRYAKIQPIDDNKRKVFMGWATDNHNIFSLGRFATWRPGLLLDDLVHDIRQIEKWITGDRWSMRLKR